ncbi:hypothetical protein [Moorena sp. SIO4G3]|uniref:hypothetical protein n=1 Tax=Moorena sp. SIO4G3 TaxID=2607821 RepID=UPI00142C3D05|nr:hypothetical protein [Moorena sp. SIO4G3]NEO82211.1 hypothetical protein [Moorena sp. SIO4G3]
MRDKNSPEDQVAKNEVNREIGEFNQKHAGTMEEIVRSTLSGAILESTSAASPDGL